MKWYEKLMWYLMLILLFGCVLLIGALIFSFITIGVEG